MFEPEYPKANPVRAQMLKLEEQRDRPFNILNGVEDYVVWPSVLFNNAIIHHAESSES